jgi:chromosome partitioning protein
MVLASMYDIRTKMGREILGELRRHFGERMFTTIVNFNTKLKEAASLGQPVSEFDPASKGHKDFEALADELVGTDTQMHRIEVVDALQSRIEAISASAEELLSAVKPIEAVKPASVIKPVEIIKPVEVAAPIEEIKPVVVSEVAEIAMPEIAEPIEVSEPAAVAEPVAVAEAVIEEPVAEVKSRSLDEKLASFYGVRQVGDAIMFASLYPRAERVELAGDFNNWQPSQTPLEKMSESGMWQIKLPMGKGRYRYRLVVDGHWQQDPYNEMTEVNPYGECNSVVEVC